MNQSLPGFWGLQIQEKGSYRGTMYNEIKRHSAEKTAGGYVVKKWDNIYSNDDPALITKKYW